MSVYTELMTVYGAWENSTATSGNFSLNGTRFSQSPSPTYVRIPRGADLAIGAISIAGSDATITTYMTTDVTAGSPTWVAVDGNYLPSAGQVSIEKKRPIVVSSPTGLAAVKFGWATPGSADGTKSGSVSVDIKISGMS